MPPYFCQTITYIDHYSEPPHGPCIRIYGSTPVGQKSCLHIHAVLPYFYVESPDNDNGEQCTEESFRAMLDALLEGDKDAVRAVRLVLDKTNIYGYHHAPARLFKVSLADAWRVKSFAELIANKLRLRVFDVHVGFLPQFLADHNLAGMDLITVRTVKTRLTAKGKMHAPGHRASRPDGIDDSNLPREWLPDDALLDRLPRPFKDTDAHGSLPRPHRTSTCELEFDAQVDDIVVKVPAPRPGSLAASKVQAVPSLIPWWDAEETRRSALALASPPTLSDEARPPGFKSEMFAKRAEEMFVAMRELQLHPGLALLFSNAAPQPTAAESDAAATATMADHESAVSSSDNDDDDDDDANVDHWPMSRPRRAMTQEEAESRIDAEWAPILDSQLDCVQSLHLASQRSPPLVNPSADTPSVAATVTPRKSASRFLPPPRSGSTLSRAISTTPRRPAVQALPGHNWLQPAMPAPPCDAPVPPVEREPFYSDPADVPAFVNGALHAAASGRPLPHALPAFPALFADLPQPAVFHGGLTWLEPAAPAPLTLSIPRTPSVPSQTQERTTAGDPSRRTSAVAASADHNHLRVLALEVIASAQPGLVSNPDVDEVLAVCMVLRDEDRDRAGDGARGAGDRELVLAVGEARSTQAWRHRPFTVWVPNERALFRELDKLVAEGDPDVILCWEMQREALGYLLDRAAKLELTGFARSLSRSPWGAQDARHGNDRYGEEEHSGLWLTGRHLFNMWRVVREKAKLAQYSLEYAAHALLKKQLPSFSAHVVAEWMASTGEQWRAVKLVLARARCVLAICDHLDVLGLLSELSRLYGTDFFSALVRGSQFKVEAVLARVVRMQSLVALSSTPRQVQHQPAMEGQPLIMEPRSGFYAGPVCVLDFRSLYPSVIIAHNLSFDTCVGKLRREPSTWLAGAPPHLRFMHEGLGVDATYRPPIAGVENVARGGGYIAPNGVCFVSKTLRHGALPRMLAELTEARAMIKATMKHEPDARVRRVFEARQFGLKDIANTTYGYAAASFSGRMPCAELADAVVMSGRYYLERAIEICERAPGAKVVYGDTDSLFVHLPGRSLDEARAAGKAMAHDVTMACPAPVQLQFDKVFMPCVLEMKKRYVGYSHAVNAGERAPFVDAKGIETVRRDACGLVGKTLARMLKLLFAGPPDLSLCRAELRLLQRRMLDGAVPDRDYILSGKVKRAYKARPNGRPGGPPAAQVLMRLAAKDARLKAKPVIKHRQPYVVVIGPKDSALYELVAAPAPGQLHNVHYYLHKQLLPALNRVFQTMGVDVTQWVADLATTAPTTWLRSAQRVVDPSKIEAYFARVSLCVLCRRVPCAAACEWCDECASRSGPQAACALIARLRADAERTTAAMDRTCGRCAFGEGAVPGCGNAECVVYEARRVVRENGWGPAPQL